MSAKPTPASAPTALIAEDEPLLAQALQAELALAWPQLRVAARVGDGLSAVREALALQPDLLFLDIRMPGQSGLEAAAELADRWPNERPLPALVFVTAFDQYAVQAFEAQAVDYIVKPVQAERLHKTVQRLQALLQQRTAGDPLADARSLAQLRALLERPDAAAAPPPLAMLQASVGHSIHLIPLDDVLLLEAADKYVRVLTAEREYLIRTPLKELLPRLDAQRFWQVHRGAVVQATAIRSVTRDEAGRMRLALRGSDEQVAVSRLYAHLFRAM